MTLPPPCFTVGMAFTNVEFLTNFCFVPREKKISFGPIKAFFHFFTCLLRILMQSQLLRLLFVKSNSFCSHKLQSRHTAVPPLSLQYEKSASQQNKLQASFHFSFFSFILLIILFFSQRCMASLFTQLSPETKSVFMSCQMCASLTFAQRFSRVCVCAHV